MRGAEITDRTCWLWLMDRMPSVDAPWSILFPGSVFPPCTLVSCTLTTRIGVCGAVMGEARSSGPTEAEAG